MSHRWLKLSLCAAAALLAACSHDATAPTLAVPNEIARSVSSLPVINVPDLDSLYRVVNNPIYAGRDVRLNPGTYRLDPTRPFGGRLQLQQDMTLRGKGGLAESTIIDASDLRTAQFMDGTLFTGAIRVGRGTNTIESLTVQHADSGAAGIETDLVGTGPTKVSIAHVISTHNVRGIDVRNIGAAMANRVLVVELSDNELVDNTTGMGQGLRLVNTNAAHGASIVATIDNNKSHGNIAGCLAANVNVNSASISIDSHADRFESNGNGCVFLTGNGAAQHNNIYLRAQASRFVSNGVEGAPPPAVDIGAIVAVGGVSPTGLASNNTLVIDLWGILFQDNVTPDIAGFGVQSSSGSPVGNSVTINLHGMSKDAIVNPPNGSTVGTNTVTVNRF